MRAFFVFFLSWIGASCVPAFSQASFLSAEAIIETVSGRWIIDDAESDSNCSNNYLTIWFSEEDGKTVYHSRWMDSQENRSFVGIMQMEDGQTFPAIILQYDKESRVDENGNLVSWALFMPDKDSFFWMRRDWQYGQRTSMRIRCPSPVLTG